MKAGNFSKHAEEARDGVLSDDSRIILNGRVAETGQQIRIYRGLGIDETRAGSIGNFLVVTAEYGRRTVAAEVIAAGSLAVRHPSYDAHFGRSPWSIATSMGTLFMGAERPDGTVGPTRLESDLIMPEEVAPIPVEVASIAEAPIEPANSPV